MTPATPPTAGKSLRILLTNITLAGRSGTETVVRNLALELLKAGHRPMVYSPRLGPIAEELRAASIPVTSDIETLEETPDVIHGHHVIQTAIALARFPDTPGLFVCHDFIAWHDTPPKLPNLRTFVTISEGFRDRLTVEAGAKPSDVFVIPNGIDTVLFQPGPPLPKAPRRALVFAKNVGHVEAIVEACRRQNIVTTVVGSAVGKVIDAPQDIIPQYDIVFASALTAMEAMACQRAVIVCDGRGLAGMATAERYEEWRRENFGLRSFTRAVTVDNILADLAAYDAKASTALGKRVRRDMELTRWSRAYEALYRRVISNFAKTGPAITARDKNRALAKHLETWDPDQSSAWARERAAMLQHIALLESGLAESHEGERILAADTARLSLNGFHAIEAWGAWSAHKRCVVRLRPAPTVALRKLTIECMPLFTPSRQKYDVLCALNGRPIGTIRFDAKRAGPYSLVSQTLDVSDHELGSMLWLSLETDQLLSPAREGLSNDRRELGFALIALKLD